MISFRRIPQIVALLIGVVAILFSLINSAHSEIDLRLDDVENALESVAPQIEIDLAEEADSLSDEWQQFSEGALYLNENHLNVARTAETATDLIESLKKSGHHWTGARWSR